MENHFEFYNIEERFFIDETKLKQLYLKLSRENHPDFFVGDEEKYDSALEFTSKNNTAYKALKSFENRLTYILKRNGMLEDKGNKLPPDFLMEMMEINEDIMELKMDFDANKYEVVDKKVGDMANLWKGKITELAHLADSEEKNKRVEVLKKIKEFYLKQKYVLRLKESLNTFAQL